MDESRDEKSNCGGAGDDYMADLSHFLPPADSTNAPRFSSKRSSIDKVLMFQQSKKKFKSRHWQQQQQQLNRRERQQVEDAQTLQNIKAPLPETNIGFKLLKQMGYSPGTTLGKEGSGGIAEPVGIEIRRTRVGLGREDPEKEKRKRDEIEAEENRRRVDDLLVEFGSRKKLQWRSRRVIVNFKKARSALDQMENRVVELPKKNEDDEDGKQKDEEEEEEVITEEDLEEILMKLRDEHRYCLFCGFQYESMEALSSNCPGSNEDDH